MVQFAGSTGQVKEPFVSSVVFMFFTQGYASTVSFNVPS